MKYEGGCHCGAISFEVELSLDRVIECNCSICSSKGYLLAFAPAAAVTLRSVPDDLPTYTFNRHAIRHQFCPTCGVAPFARGADADGSGGTFAINVRCLAGVDIDALDPQPYDGRRL